MDGDRSQLLTTIDDITNSIDVRNRGLLILAHDLSLSHLDVQFLETELLDISVTTGTADNGIEHVLCLDIGVGEGGTAVLDGVATIGSLDNLQTSAGGEGDIPPWGRNREGSGRPGPS